MITLSKLLFWVPFISIILFLLLFTKWNKYDTLMFLSAFPAIYFMIKIIEYSYEQPIQLFDYYLKGLVISLILYVIFAFLLLKKNKA